MDQTLSPLDLKVKLNLEVPSPARLASARSSSRASTHRQKTQPTEPKLVAFDSSRCPQKIEDLSLNRYISIDSSMHKFRSQKSTIRRLNAEATRLTKYYPDLLKISDDEYFIEFTLRMHRDKIANQKLCPEAVQYAKPDFGFNDVLIFDEQETRENGWAKFLDCFSLARKYERVKNYIDFIHEKKIEKLKKEIPKDMLRKFAQQNKFNGSGKFANLELLRQVELNKKIMIPRDEPIQVVVPTKEEQEVLGLKEEINELAKVLDSQKDFTRQILRSHNRMIQDFDTAMKDLNQPKPIIKLDSQLGSCASFERAVADENLESPFPKITVSNKQKEQHKDAFDSSFISSSIVQPQSVQNSQIQDRYAFRKNTNFTINKGQSSYVQQEASLSSKIEICRLKVLEQMEILIKYVWSKKLNVKCQKPALIGYRFLLCNQLQSLDFEKHLEIMKLSEVQNFQNLKRNEQLLVVFRDLVRQKFETKTGRTSQNNTISQTKECTIVDFETSVADSKPFEVSRFTTNLPSRNGSTCRQEIPAQKIIIRTKTRPRQKQLLQTTRQQKNDEMAEWLMGCYQKQKSYRNQLSQSTTYSQGLASHNENYVKNDSSTKQCFNKQSSVHQSTFIGHKTIDEALYDGVRVKNFLGKPRTPLQNAQRKHLRRLIPQQRLSTANNPDLQFQLEL